MHDFLAAGLHWQLLNFAIFLGILYAALKNPVREFWQNRSQEIRSRIEETEAKAREAKTRHDSAGLRVAGLEKESAGILISLKNEGEEEKKKMIEEAEKPSRRIAGDREKIIAQEIQKARQGLRNQVIQLSIEMAEKSIVESFQEEDQKRLSDRYLSQLEGGAV